MFMKKSLTTEDTEDGVGEHPANEKAEAAMMVAIFFE